jgi:hypothetical protein
MILTPKVHIAFCLSLLLWLFAAWGMTWSRTGNAMTDFVAEAGLPAAGFLIVLGWVMFRVAGSAGGHEGPAEARRLALIIIAAGILGGLITFALHF